MNRTERLAAIEQMLFRSSIGLRAVEIADACGVDRRTIYRDLTLLTDVGVPVHQQDGRFYIDRENYTATTRLTFDEAVSLFLASRIAAHFDVQHNPHRTSALSKLSFALPWPLAEHLDVVIDVEEDATIDLRFLSVLETITRAWSERHKVKLWCAGNGADEKPKARDFSPYFVEPNTTGALCAVGYDSLTQTVSAFKLRDIRRARLTTAPYQVPAQFDVRRYLVGGWSHLTSPREDSVKVVLLFSPQAVPLLKERQWPASQRFEMADDNSVRLTMSVGDWHDVLPWIRSWGADVQVLEPPSLRQACALEAARMIAHYRSEARAIGE